MKISKKSEYGVCALIEMTLQARAGKEWRQTSQIAERSGIPEKYLEQILLTLKKGGVLKSKRGIDGGYALDVDTKDISLYEIFCLLEGDLSPNSSGADSDDPISSSLNLVTSEAAEASKNVLNNKKLSSLADQVERLRREHQTNIEYQI